MPETSINESLKISSTNIDLNHNLISIIGGRGSGKTALLDLIASCFKEGAKLKEIKNSFIYRLYTQKNDNNPVEINLETISSDIFNKKIGQDNFYFEQSNILYITQNHFEEFSSNYRKLNKYVLELIFQTFPDEKSTHENYEYEVQSVISEIQKINLSIQQLSLMISSKNELYINLKQKEGEKKDLVKRITELEEDSSFGKEIKELSEKIDELRTEKQKIESLIFNIINLNKNINSVENIIQSLIELNQAVQHNASSFGLNIKTYPAEQLDVVLSEIKATSFTNEAACRQKLLLVSQKIGEYQSQLSKYSDKNKMLTQLQDKLSTTSKDIDSINNQIQEIHEFESKIKFLEEQRNDYYESVLVVYLKWKNFLNRIIKNLENHDNLILSSLSFDVSTNLKEKNDNGINK